MLPNYWQRKLIDTNITALIDTDILWADMVFISDMDLHRDSFLSIAKRCYNLGATVVGGGPFFTIHHCDIEPVDYFMLGEAEAMLPLFLRDLVTGHPRRVYAADEYPDVKTTPIPEWDLLDMDAYAGMEVQYSRGCPFDCEFCAVTALFGHKPRCKATQQFLGELEALYLAGWRGEVFVVDDNFFGNRRRPKEDLLPALTRWSAEKRFPFILSAEASVNLADDPPLVEGMVAAGFRMVFVGIETPDEESLGECGKTQNQGRDLAESVKYLQRSDLNVTAGFIVGFDNDRESIFDRQIEFIQKSSIVTAMVGLLMAETGTKLFERLKRENRIVARTTGNNNEGVLNYIPKLDRSTLITGYRRLVRTIYSPKEYYKRVKTFFSEYRLPRPSISTAVPIKSNPRALFRATWRLGIKEKGCRSYFWMFLAYILRTYPRAFAKGVRLAIYGYHFRMVAAEI